MATKTAAKTSAKTSAKAASVTARLAKLRELAGTDASAAQEEAWKWFRDAGRSAAKDRAAADAELDALFRAGTPATGIDGPTKGILVATVVNPAVDAITRLVTSVVMPWQGKRFDSARSRGDNLLVPAIEWPMKLLWPLYRTGAAEGARTAFEFETRVEAGHLDPDVDVLVLDYGAVDANPRLVIKRIRDELVEVVPGTYLGKILWHRGRGRYTNLGYFALRTQV